MEYLKRLFGSLTGDISPGVQDPVRVVRDRMVYGSAGESRKHTRGFQGDSMGIDLNDLDMPVENPEETLKQAASKAADAGFDSPAFDKAAMAVDSLDRAAENAAEGMPMPFEPLEKLEGIEKRLPSDKKDGEGASGLKDLMGMD